MFYRKILLSKGLIAKDKEEWPEELAQAWVDFTVRGFSQQKILVIDYVFNKVKRIAIKEMPHELTKSKEKEMILKLKPLLNHETNSEEYNRLHEELE